jgi:hypothetical protein
VVADVEQLVEDRLFLRVEREPVCWRVGHVEAVVLVVLSLWVEKLHQVVVVWNTINRHEPLYLLDVRTPPHFQSGTFPSPVRAGHRHSPPDPSSHAVRQVRMTFSDLHNCIRCIAT